MSVSISKDGPYFSSGSISFSALRDTFRRSGGSIKASELRRYTDVNIANPVVPDCTENAAISSGSNLSLSQFRNSIKFYYITQSGTDISLSLHSSSYWNNNLGKNIVKTAYVTGVNGENTIDVAALRHRGDNFPTRNLTIQVSGQIYGAGGIGGGRSRDPISGTRGGGAFRVEGSGGGTARVRVIITSSGRVWAGGGGGEKGRDGGRGNDGYCPEDCGWRNTYCQGNSPGGDKCPGGYRYSHTRWVRCCGGSDRNCHTALWEVTCCRPGYATSGGNGGTGGRGGNGRGYNNFSGSLAGEPGSAGTSGGGCGAGNGQNGERGGDGGEWGRRGGDTSNIGIGGWAGPAIFGKNFDLSGNVNSDTVRGYIDYSFSSSAEYLR